MTALFLCLHGQLFDLDPNGNVVPDIVEKYEVSADGLAYTFHLNEKARWHDGVPVTAADVEFSFVAYTAARSGSRQRKEIFGNILGSEEVVASTEKSMSYADSVKFKGIEILDDHTIRFTMMKPDPLWLTQFGNNPGWFSLLPKHLLEYVPWEKWLEHPLAKTRPIGCGPYKFVKGIDGQYWELAAFEDYHLGRPKIDRIFFKSWLDVNVAAAQLESGELDLVLALNLDDAERLQGKSGIAIASCPASNAYQLSIRTDRITDKRVRKAIAYAIDREAIWKNIFKGLGEINECCLLQEWAIPPGQTVLPHDPAKARALLAEANWDSNRVLRVLYPAGYRYADVLLPIIQQQLAEVGIKIEMNPLETTAFKAALKDPQAEWDIFYNQSANMFPDPGSFALWACGDLQADIINKGANLSWVYCDPHWKELWDRGRSTTDQSERAKIYQEIQSIFYEEMPAVNIVLPPSIYGLRSRLKGFAPTPQVWNSFWNVYSWSVSE
ncbi:MAG: ABC transporter substrate-binding protein [Anaerolineae bacterium]